MSFGQRLEFIIHLYEIQYCSMLPLDFLSDGRNISLIFLLNSGPLGLPSLASISLQKGRGHSLSLDFLPYHNLSILTPGFNELFNYLILQESTGKQASDRSSPVNGTKSEDGRLEIEFWKMPCKGLLCSLKNSRVP